MNSFQKLYVFIYLLVIYGAHAFNPSSKIKIATCDADTRFECGEQIGRSMKNTIKNSFETDADFQKILAFIKTKKGKQVFHELVAVNNKTYPMVMKEIEGLASGTGLPLETLLAINLENELFFLRKDLGHGPKSCTDYHTVGADRSAWVHNEDEVPAFKKSTYLVRANITGKQSDEESSVYIGFAYPGCVVGWAWGFNQHGHAQSINALFPEETKTGLAVNFVARDVLDSTSLADAERRATIHGQNSGQHFNIGNLKNPTRQLSVETGLKGHDVKNITKDSIFPKSPAHLPAGDFAHCNLYTRLYIQRGEEEPSTYHRMKRIASMTPAQSVDDLLTVNSDNADKEYPIYRDASAPDSCLTIVTVLFDVMGGNVSVFTERAINSNATYVFDWFNSTSWKATLDE